MCASSTLFVWSLLKLLFLLSDVGMWKSQKEEIIPHLHHHHARILSARDGVQWLTEGCHINEFIRIPSMRKMLQNRVFNCLLNAFSIKEHLERIHQPTQRDFLLFFTISFITSPSTRSRQVWIDMVMSFTWSGWNVCVVFSPAVLAVQCDLLENWGKNQSSLWTINPLISFQVPLKKKLSLKSINSPPPFSDRRPRFKIYSSSAFYNFSLFSPVFLLFVDDQQKLSKWTEQGSRLVPLPMKNPEKHKKRHI